MAKLKLLPYINRFTGEIKTLPQRLGSKLNEDWARAKMATNQDGDKVFRFHLNAEVTGKDGKKHMGTAVVDLTPNDVPVELEAKNGKRKSK